MMNLLNSVMNFLNSVVTFLVKLTAPVTTLCKTVLFYLDFALKQLNNAWIRFRNKHHEYILQAVAMFMLVFIVNTGTFNAQLTDMTQDTLTTFVSTGIGVTIGVLYCTNISEPHLSPTVTMAKMFFEHFGVKRAALYISAQLIGSFVATLLVYLLSSTNMSTYQGNADPRQRFYTVPPGNAGVMTALIWEFAGSVYIMTTFHIIESYNPKLLLKAMLIGFLVFGFSMGTRFVGVSGSNPARDMAGRCVVAMISGDPAPFLNSHGFWILGPWVATTLGSMTAMSGFKLMHRMNKKTIPSAHADTPRRRLSRSLP